MRSKLLIFWTFSRFSTAPPVLACSFSYLPCSSRRLLGATPPPAPTALPGLRPGPRRAAPPTRHPPGLRPKSRPRKRGGTTKVADTKSRRTVYAAPPASTRRVDLACKQATPRGREDPDKSRPSGKAGRSLSRARVRAVRNQRRRTRNDAEYGYPEGGGSGVAEGSLRGLPPRCGPDRHMDGARGDRAPEQGLRGYRARVSVRRRGRRALHAPVCFLCAG